MVNIGDVVAVTFYARFGFQVDPLAQPTAALQSRLQASGFKVLKIDATALSAIETGLTLGLGGWGWVNVSVAPLSSAYGSAQDVASVIAGAAYAVGFEVDFNKVQGAVVAVNPNSQAVLSPEEYAANQAATDKVTKTDVFGELAGMLGISKSTLTVAVIGIGALAAWSAIK